MNKIPFFSILLPTKNRSHIVSFAIQSILDQTFKDFEIIVADNDDSEDTKKTISKFDDPRIKYYRTGGLDMPQNWEFALRQTTGQFITVLEDKQAYYQWALFKIHNEVTKHKSNVVVWHWDRFDEVKNELTRNKWKCDPKKVKISSILSLYTKKPIYTSSKYLPRMLNSCVNKDVILECVNNSKDKIFFSKLSPDLCASFRVLAEVEDILYLDNAIGAIGYTSLSNANTIRKTKTSNQFEFYGLRSKASIPLDHVDIKSIQLTYNMVYEDFLRIRSENNGKLLKYKMSDNSYIKTCLWDVFLLYTSKAQTPVITENLKKIFKYSLKKTGVYNTILLHITVVILTFAKYMNNKYQILLSKKYNNAKNILKAISLVHE